MYKIEARDQKIPHSAWSVQARARSQRAAAKRALEILRRANSQGFALAVRVRAPSGDILADHALYAEDGRPR